MNTLAARNHATLMDRIYRRQRHIYDLTRKYYLLGRDRLIEGLDCSAGQSVLELGCGTGRNLAAISKRWPNARLHGLDISSEMLATARRQLARPGNGSPVRFAQGDATDFDPQTLFAEPGFDRIVLSYTLSMVPDWRSAITAALAALNPGGQLHVVDFGAQRDLPRWFGGLLNRWLGMFHVMPRFDLETALAEATQSRGAITVSRQLFGGYTVLATVRLDAPEAG